MTLFFTRRVGLYQWDEVGNLDRELAIYQQLTQHLRQVTFITYGGKRDHKYVSQLNPLHIAHTPRRLPVFVSRLILRNVHNSILQQSDIFKTNQIPGAELAIWAKKKYNKKLITRCGYLYSRFMEAHTTNQLRIGRAYTLEHKAFTVADAGVVTSERDRQWVINTHHIAPEKIHVIPNYVVTDVFKPDPDAVKKYDLVCVSKASPQKNLAALLQAMGQLKQQKQRVSLLIIGSASQDQALVDQAKTLELDVSWIPRVANFELPRYLNQARLFILPSLYEGHPKALLEAMSCGLPCIGTDIPGIREDITHLQTGYLCQTNPAALTEAIQLVLQDEPLQLQLGRQAREYVVGRYSVETILRQELALIERVLTK